MKEFAVKLALLLSEIPRAIVFLLFLLFTIDVIRFSFPIVMVYAPYLAGAMLLMLLTQILRSALQH